MHPDFIHRFVPARVPGAPTLLLLHGTGGDESNLLPLGDVLFPGAAVLSPRGKVLEHGMPRFFRRLAEGVFDLDDLIARTHEVAEFVVAATAEYGFDAGTVVAVGFSNGANIAASLLLLRPGILSGAILFRPMVPLVPETLPRLNGVPVFVAAGRQDPIVPPANTEQLVELLREAGAEVAVHLGPGGHALTDGDVAAARRWLTATALEARGDGGRAGRPCRSG